MAYQRGDIWLVKYPYTDLSSTKVRPAVICSTDAYHAEQPDIIVAALTSSISAATASLDYILQDWTAAGRRFESAFKPVVATLDPSLALHRVGEVASIDLKEIESRLRRAFAL